MLTLADLRGACRAHASPMGPNSFVFAYIFTEKCLHWRSTTPPNGCTPPYGKFWIRHWLTLKSYCPKRRLALADPGGHRGVRPPPPPNRINFFRFCIRFCQKVYASEVGTPPTGRRPPQREILDPPLVRTGLDNRLEMINKDGYSFLLPASDRDHQTINGYRKWEVAFRVYAGVYTDKVRVRRNK